MNTIDHVVVVIPAADEQESIQRSVESVAAAFREMIDNYPRITGDTVVVLDRSTDATAELLEQYVDVMAITADARNVGVARQIGSAAALTRAPCLPSRVWLANTDADSVVPRSWLVDHVRQAEDGVEVLLGTVEPDVDEPVLSRWRALHVESDGHPHIHGANLGIRGDALVRLGGWPRSRTGEDVELVRAAASMGLRVASVGGLTVLTSSRLVGRAPEGFSSYIHGLQVGMPCGQSRRSGSFSP